MAPGAETPAVTEMALALMLACLRRLPALDRASRTGSWWPGGGGEPAFGELGGRIVGLVGYGPVPARLAPALKALGATVAYWHGHREPGADAAFVPLRELLETSDIVSAVAWSGPNRRAYLDEIARLRSAGADGVILGRTEITMLVGQADLDLGLRYHRIHAEAAIDFATGASS